MAVANYGGDTGKGCDFLWGTLGVASGDHQLGCWIEAMGLANEGAGIAVGLCGYAAGIDDYDVGFG